MLPNQEFVYTRTYSRWNDDLKRRESWPETCARVFHFFKKAIPQASQAELNRAEKSMRDMHTMPSMRVTWSAGEALEKNNICGYNCSYSVIKDIRSFSEILFILMCGTGAGFSVERRFVDELPAIQPKKGIAKQVQIADSREGWAKGLDEVLNALWEGYDVEVDYSLVRPNGARLKTMGGRASGPEPLKSLFDFAVAMLDKRRGQRLSPLDCHDLVCKIAEVVVVGGVRRSSLISLSDQSDGELAHAKTGEFWVKAPHRAMSNNSAVYNTKPEMLAFMKEWFGLAASGTGERGIFNREAALKQMAHSGRREADSSVGTNPCGEICLRPNQKCNLSEVVVRPEDTLETLRTKVRTATMVGCWQSTLTKFPYLRQAWRKNCEEERLLGVSLTGMMDHPVLNHVNDEAKVWLTELKHAAIAEAKKWARKLEINVPTAITCVKPSGTVSQLTNSASGIHARYGKYYIRRYRISAGDPLFKMLRDQGVPAHPEVGQEPNTASTWVLEFPTQAPEASKTRHDYTAIQQLEHWLMVKQFWAEHNPSITVYVGDDEWLKVGAWVYEHFDAVCGVSFLPKDGGVYRLAPYSEITAEEYKELHSKFPVIDYSQLSKYEIDDQTEGAKTYACIGDKCEI